MPVGLVLRDGKLRVRGGALRVRDAAAGGGGEPGGEEPGTALGTLDTTVRVDDLTASGTLAEVAYIGLPLAENGLAGGEHVRFTLSDGTEIPGQIDAESFIHGKRRFVAARCLLPPGGAAGTSRVVRLRPTSVAPAQAAYTRAQLAAAKPTFGWRVRLQDASAASNGVYYYATLTANDLTVAENAAYLHASPQNAYFDLQWADGRVVKGYRFRLVPKDQNGAAMFGSNPPHVVLDVAVESLNDFSSAPADRNVMLYAHLVTAWYQQVPVARSLGIRFERRLADSSWVPYVQHQYSVATMDKVQRGAIFGMRLDGSTPRRTLVRAKSDYLRHDCGLLPGPNLASGIVDPTGAAQFMPDVTSLDASRHPWGYGILGPNFGTDTGYYWGRTGFDNNGAEGQILVQADLYCLADKDSEGYIAVRAADAARWNAEAGFGLPYCRLDTGTGRQIRWNSATFQNNGDNAPAGNDFLYTYSGDMLSHSTDPFYIGYLLTGLPHYLTGMAAICTYGWHNATYSVPSVKNPSAVWQRSFLLGSSQVRSGVWSVNALLNLLSALPDGAGWERLTGIAKADVLANWAYTQSHAVARLVNRAWTGATRPDLGEPGAIECHTTRVQYGQSGFQNAWANLVLARAGLMGALDDNGKSLLRNYVGPLLIELYARDGENVGSGFLWNAAAAAFRAYHPHCFPPTTTNWTATGDSAIMRTYLAWAQNGRQDGISNNLYSQVFHPGSPGPGDPATVTFGAGGSRVAYAAAREIGSLAVLHAAYHKLGFSTTRVNKALQLALKYNANTNGIAMTSAGAEGERHIAGPGTEKTSREYVFKHGPIGVDPTSPPPPPSDPALLLEDGSYFLLEDSSRLLLG